MADESDRNLWDVLGLPNKTDASSIQEKEHHLCTNGVQEGDLDKAQSDIAQGTSLSQKVKLKPISVSITDVQCCSNSPDVPVKNGGDATEQRHTQQVSAVKILASQRRDLPGEKEELVNGETFTALKYSASVNSGSVESTVEPPRDVPEAAERNVVIAVQANNNNQAEKSAVTQERSIFEHINSNFRSAVVPLQNHVREKVTSETGMHRNTSETAVSSNVICLSDTIRNAEPTGDTMDKKNLCERLRINSYIDSLAQRPIATEGNGFPFSDKLRHLTTINKEAGNNMSTMVHPLRTGYDTVTSGRSFQQFAPVSVPRSASNAVAARVVNGQLQSLGAQVITPPEVSQVDSNVIFPSMAPFKYPNAVSTSANNSYPNRQVTPVYNALNGTAVVRNNSVIDTNKVAIQPNAVSKLKRIAAERPNGEHVQKNLAATHLIGPFISAGPPPPNTYVAAVRTAQAQTLTNGLQSAAYPQFQDVRSTLKGHSSSSGFQLVLPVGITPVGIPPPSVVNRILRPPISLTSLEENTPSKSNQRNLVCGEKLVPSPDLQERIFRPVSPAKSGMNSRTSPSPRAHHDGFSRGTSRGFHCSPLRARRSIFSRKTNEPSRGSVEEELAEQSYECALRESANSPDIERYLRCESPVTVLSSPNTKSSCNSYENNSAELPESSVNPLTLCNGETENVDIPSTYPEENTEDCASPKTPPSTDSGISGEEAADASKRKLNKAMVRRLEPRLPSPVRARSVGDLYRDPSQLTREERALQRAMMQFSEMEMKEKAKEIKKKDSLKRRLRKRPKDKPNTITSDTTKQSATKVWLKKFKRKRLWFSQRRSITVKPPVQEDDSLVKKSEHQQTQPVKRKRSSSKNDNTEQPKIRRKSVETDKQALVAKVKAKDVHQAKAVLPNHKNTGAKPAKVRRTSSHTRSLEKNKKENLPESTSCKRSFNTDIDMKTRGLKRPRVEIEPLAVKKQDVLPPNHADNEKGDKSHRIKTYMLVAAYQGFRDFKPIVLESRTRGKPKQTDEEPQEKPSKASEFPLLVVESVNSKPVKNSIIAENEEVQHLVENCLKARGKWQIDETVEESVNEDENLKEARKLNVNRNTGETILHKAARLGYHETVHHHIHQGIDPNAKDNAGWTPLHEACSRGHVDVVKVLAKYGADVNACSNDGIRPIHDAAEGGHVGVLRVLLSYGADPLLATYSGNTALSCTKEPNSSAFLKGFLEDLDLKTPSTSACESEGCWDFSGSCPLFDDVPDHTSGIFEGVPKNHSLQDGEFEMCERPHLQTYNLPVMTSDDVVSGRRNYVLLSDVLEHLRISRGALLKKAKRLDIREMPWSQFMAEISDRPLCIAPKYSPPDSSTQEGVAELVSVNYNLRRLLNIRIESVNMT